MRGQILLEFADPKVAVTQFLLQIGLPAVQAPLCFRGANSAPAVLPST
jgi:hypothetical protein